MTTLARYELISLDSIVASPYQARKTFNDEALSGLAESMKQEGLIEPIVVRPLESGYELISGERRLRAAKLLGWETIEARIITTISEGEAAAKGLVENLQREDLNPLEEAEGFADLYRVDSSYWTHDRIAETVGKSRSYITYSLSLLKLPEEIREYVRQRTLTRGHALELIRLPSAEVQLEVAKSIPDVLTVKETRKIVDQILSNAGAKKSKTPKSSKVDPLSDLWKRLKESSIAPKGSWDVQFGPISGSAKPGWHVWMGATGGNPTTELAHLLRGIADAIDGHPATPSISSVLNSENKNLRLPNSSNEQAELEALAEKGPFEFYSWIYGEESLTAQSVKTTTWADLQVSDPQTTCRELIAGLRDMRSADQN